MGNRRRFNLGDVIESIHSKKLVRITDIRMATMEYTFETYPASTRHKYVERWHDVDSNFVLYKHQPKGFVAKVAEFRAGDSVKILDDDSGHGHPIGSIQAVKKVLNNGINLEGGMYALFGDIELAQKPVDEFMDGRTTKRVGVGEYIVNGSEWKREYKAEFTGHDVQTFDSALYCSCERPTLKLTSTAVHGKATKENSYQFCTTCKKERS